MHTIACGMIHNDAIENGRGVQVTGGTRMDSWRADKMDVIYVPRGRCFGLTEEVLDTTSALGIDLQMLPLFSREFRAPELSYP